MPFRNFCIPEREREKEIALNSVLFVYRPLDDRLLDDNRDITETRACGRNRKFMFAAAIATTKVATKNWRERKSLEEKEEEISERNL